jgi:hypothetical protein
MLIRVNDFFREETGWPSRCSARSGIARRAQRPIQMRPVLVLFLIRNSTLFSICWTGLPKVIQFLIEIEIEIHFHNRALIER